MPIDKFIIGYTDDKSGVQTNFQPWLLPDNAYQSMINAYTWRGRVRKRIGSVLIDPDNINASRFRVGNIPIVPVGPDLIATFPINLAVGMEIEEQTLPGFSFKVVDITIGAALLSVTASTAVMGPAANQITIVGVTVFLCYLYPHLPVTGLGQFEQLETNSEITVGFDTRFAYVWDETFPQPSWVRLTTGDDLWSGTSDQLFWIVNYRGATASENYLWVTNFNAADGIRFRNAIAGGAWRKPTLFYSKGPVIGTTDGAGNFVGALGSAPVLGSIVIVASTAFVVISNAAGFQPMAVIPLTTNAPVGTATCDFGAANINIAAAAINTAVYYSDQLLITTARIIVQFKNRLILLNTIERVGGVDTQFKNRCRFSAVGNPLLGSSGTVFTSVSFMADLPGFGNAIDAATQEAIISAEFLKDRLIVYFERSTWELVYTGNQIYPFTWQKINTELGVESTFSVIPFDKTVLGFGNVGIHGCTGANVTRIDEKIPNFVFDIHNLNSGVQRVVGIRNYEPEVAIWTYPGPLRDANFPFPNRLIVYNYVNNSWSFIKDSYTFFGFHQSAQTTSSTSIWGSTSTLWGQASNPWGGSVGTYDAVKTIKVIAGNQTGMVHILDYNVTNNAIASTITGVSNTSGVVNQTLTTNTPIYLHIVNHNLEAGDYISISTLFGLTVTYTDPSTGTVYNLDSTKFIARVVAVTNANEVEIVAGKIEPAGLFLFDITGTYRGLGRFARVSMIEIASKDFNLYVGKDYDAYISRINFLVDRTQSNYIRVNYNISTARSLGLPQLNDALLGNSQLETFPYVLAPFEQNQAQIWHNVYLAADGEFVQIVLANDNDQPFDFTFLGDPATATTNYGIEQDFQMHSMIIYAQPSSSGLQ